MISTQWCLSNNIRRFQFDGCHWYVLKVLKSYGAPLTLFSWIFPKLTRTNESHPFPFITEQKGTAFLYLSSISNKMNLNPNLKAVYDVHTSKFRSKTLALVHMAKKALELLGSLIRVSRLKDGPDVESQCGRSETTWNRWNLYSCRLVIYTPWQHCSDLTSLTFWLF